jgi:hypothetical protein
MSLCLEDQKPQPQAPQLGLFIWVLQLAASPAILNLRRDVSSCAQRVVRWDTAIRPEYTIATRMSSAGGSTLFRLKSADA